MADDNDPDDTDATPGKLWNEANRRAAETRATAREVFRLTFDRYGIPRPMPDPPDERFI